jgi:Calcium/calmodulin dependent protein kinase II association domain
MTFKQALHRHLEALERRDAHARLYATPLEIHEASDAGVAVLHLLYCEDEPGKRPLRSQSHLTLVYQRRDEQWVVVEDRHRAIG